MHNKRVGSTAQSWYGSKMRREFLKSSLSLLSLADGSIQLSNTAMATDQRRKSKSVKLRVGKLDD